MASKILITGANGLVGYASAVHMLQQGYQVVAAVRRQDAVDTIAKLPSIQKHLESGALTFAIIQDVTQEDAFLEAAEGAHAIVHVGAPLAFVPGIDHYKFTIDALKAVIHAAEKIDSVKRIIWTGSTLGAVVPFAHLNSTLDDKDISIADNKSSVEVPPEVPSDAPPFEKYARGKAAGLNFLKTYARDHPEASFDLVSLLPGWIIGSSELYPTQAAAAYTGLALPSFSLNPYYGVAVVMGVAPERWAEVPLGSTAVHIDDVAEAHTKAITVDVPDKHEAFILSADGINGVRYNDATAIIKNSFPALAQKVDSNAFFGTVTCKVDASATEEKLLKRPFKSYETMVVDTIRWMTSLPVQ